MLTYFSTLIVGAVFLVAGAVKALSSEKFIEHTFKYELLPEEIVPEIAIIFIGLECSLGVALLLHEFPKWLVSGSMVLLLCLSALTIWSTSSGRTNDCGCYGGLMVITPKQSILLNLGYIGLLGLAWLYPVAESPTATWQWVLALLVLVAGTILAWQSQYEPLVDFSPLKAGNPWKPNWLPEKPQDWQQGSHFVVFLNKDCPYCKQWIPLLNFINTQKDMPQVIGVVSLTEEEIEVFKAEHLVRFPITRMNELVFAFLVDSFPTAILIEDGLIASKWLGEIPPKFSDRIRQFYESVVFNQKPKAHRFSG